MYREHLSGFTIGLGLFLALVVFGTQACGGVTTTSSMGSTPTLEFEGNNGDTELDVAISFLSCLKGHYPPTHETCYQACNLVRQIFEPIFESPNLSWDEMSLEEFFATYAPDPTIQDLIGGAVEACLQKTPSLPVCAKILTDLCG